MALEKIETSQIKNQVYEKCKAMIVNSEWKPGDKLPSENQLCIQLGVSRVSVRAALQALSAQGFIEIRRGEGSYVKKYDISETLDLLQPVISLNYNDILEVLEFRLVAEPSMMQLVVRKATDNDIAFLEANLEKMKTTTDDMHMHAKLDEQFHLKLTEIVSNTIINKVYVILLEVFNSAWDKVCGILGPEAGIQYHSELITAIKSRDEEGARRIMHDHVKFTYDKIVEYYNSKSEVTV